jgi:hypothetical protein
LRISSQSRHSARTVLTKRSAIAFAFGARTGVCRIRIRSLRKTPSKGPSYLVSRSRIMKRIKLKRAWQRQKRESQIGGSPRFSSLEPELVVPPSDGIQFLVTRACSGREQSITYEGGVSGAPPVRGQG